jgi:hypothetical protein
MQLRITVTKDQASAPVTSKLTLVDTASPDTSLPASHPANLGLTSLQAVMDALGKQVSREKVPFAQSQLTTILRPCLGGAAKAMIVVNLCPTDLNFAGTMESLKFATTARGVKVDANTGAQSAAVALQIKNMESKVRRANAEVKETMTKYSLIESSYNETKKSAQELVQQMREHSAVIAARYAEEQEQNKLLAGTYVSLFSMLFFFACVV